MIKKDEWWLGDPEDLYYNAAAEAIHEHWGVSPLMVREGGTLRVIGFLEDTVKVFPSFKLKTAFMPFFGVNSIVTAHFFLSSFLPSVITGSRIVAAIRAVFRWCSFAQ